MKGGRQPGAGNPGYGLNMKVASLKGMLLDAVIEDCKKYPEKKLYWADRFSGKLMPNEIVGGEGGPIQMEIKDSQYARILQREASSIIGRAAGDNETCSS